MIRLAFRVRPADAETVLAELTELAPTGVEERDLGDTIEYAVYGAEGELPSLPSVRALIGDALVDVVSEEVADDWADRWRQFHEPILIKDRLYVRPPWCPPYAEVSAVGASGDAGATAALSSDDGTVGRPAASEVLELVVDPGQAFGTGAHATTRLCLELLVELADEAPAPADGRGPVLDLGSGSGVLAVAAAQLGWGPVHGVDHEEASVAATIENAQVNGVQVTADRFDLLRQGASGMGALDDGRPPLVLANLLRPLLLRAAPRADRLGPPGPRARRRRRGLRPPRPDRGRSPDARRLGRAAAAARLRDAGGAGGPPAPRPRRADPVGRPARGDGAGPRGGGDRRRPRLPVVPATAQRPAEPRHGARDVLRRPRRRAALARPGSRSVDRRGGGHRRASTAGTRRPRRTGDRRVRGGRGQLAGLRRAGVGTGGVAVSLAVHLAVDDPL
jgi:ribosomal protein L11 methyltransferase